MPRRTDLKKVLIIGSGPAGYTAALYTSGLSGLTPGGNPPTTVAAWITFSVQQQ